MNSGSICTFISIIFGMAIAGGCGLDSSNTSTTTNFTGTFTGTETGTQNGVNFSQTVSLILTQVGTSVTGTYETGSTSAGTVSATASGSTLSSLQITSTGQCAGTASGDLNLSGNTLSGSVSGSFGSCGALSANLNLAKQ